MEKTDVSVGNWLLTFVLMSIPLVNIIMLFVWALGSGPVSKQNWAKAVLIMTVIVTVLWFVFLGALVSQL